MSNPAEAARAILEDMAKAGNQVIKQTIRIVFNNTFVTLHDSAITVGREQTSLYLGPLDVEKLANAIRPVEPKTKPKPNGKAAPQKALSYPDE